jgi:uncharacterized protein (DUF1330 family)
VTVYAIAQLRFTDRAAYDRYQASVMDVFRLHRGTLLAADEAAFRELVQSPEYRDIASDRRAGADTVAPLVQGLG